MSLAKELKLDSLELNSIAIQCEDRNKHVLQKDVIERSFPFKFIGEEVFTSSILSVAEGRNGQAYFSPLVMVKGELMNLRGMDYLLW